MLDKKFVRRGLFLVFLILFLDIMGIAIIVPVLPTYLEELTGRMSARPLSTAGGCCSSIRRLQFLFAPLIGNLSDRFGRRPVLLASVLTFAVDNLICALATSYWMLFIGRSLAGISGASFGTASAYIADVSDDENRAKNFGLIALPSHRFALGPVIGGFPWRIGPESALLWCMQRSPSSISSWGSFLCRKRSPRANGALRMASGQSLGALKQMRHSGDRLGRSLSSSSTAGSRVYPAVWSFVASYRYGWSEGQIGFRWGSSASARKSCGAGCSPVSCPHWEKGAPQHSGSLSQPSGWPAMRPPGKAGWSCVIVATALESLADRALRSIASVHGRLRHRASCKARSPSYSSITTILGPLMFTKFSPFSPTLQPPSLFRRPLCLAGCLIVARW